MTFSEARVRADADANDGAIIAESVRQPERFAVIFDRYFTEIHRYVERRLGTDAADEIAADTFLAVFGKRQRYRFGQRTARPWLYGIATNLVGKHRRRSGSAVRAYQRVEAAAATEGHADQVAARVSAQQRN